MAALFKRRTSSVTNMTAVADVVAAYWLFLGRAPESAEAIGQKLRLGFPELTQRFLAAKEFQDRLEILSRRWTPDALPGSPSQEDMANLEQSAYVRSLGVKVVYRDIGLIRGLVTALRNEVESSKINTGISESMFSAAIARIEDQLEFYTELDNLWKGLSSSAFQNDVRMAYRLCLGREPESGAVLAGQELSIARLIWTLLSSDEFYDHIYAPLVNGELASGHRFLELLLPDTLAWFGQINFSVIEVEGALTPKVIFESFIGSRFIQALAEGGMLKWSASLLKKTLVDADDGLATHQLVNGKVTHVYVRSHLNLVLNRVYDLPDVEVDDGAPSRVNILVPAFDFSSMSAGFFGVFQVARFIKACGFRVRLVMFDNFHWNDIDFRQKLSGYPGMEKLFDELEYEYIGSRVAPLIISPTDKSVATVWYSAYLAQKISNLADKSPFLYLIQDYETNFFAGGSHFALAEETYSMNYNALFSTEPLERYFVKSGIGRFGTKAPKYTYFNNACASMLPPKAGFGERRRPRLAFYSRPVVHRNMFELGALALTEAYRSGVFRDRDWELVGIGLGNAAIQLSSNRKVEQMERLNLKDYMRVISTFDVGLCLMASPHPSLLPFDLAGSGAVAVTNTFMTKQQSYFDTMCGNIIAKSPTIPALVEGIGEAVSRSENYPQRYERALSMRYPTTWEKTFTPDHAEFIKTVLS